jgi:hypothetical protein
MAPHPAGCPGCGEPYGRAFGQDYAQFRVTGTVYGDPKTFGQQAELNAKRLGSELHQKMWDPALQPERKYTGPLPAGASLAQGTGETPPWRDGSYGNPTMDKPLDLKAVADPQKYILSGEK